METNRLSPAWHLTTRSHKLRQRQLANVATSITGVSQCKGSLLGLVPFLCITLAPHHFLSLFMCAICVVVMYKYHIICNQIAY